MAAREVKCAQPKCKKHGEHISPENGKKYCSVHIEMHTDHRTNTVGYGENLRTIEISSEMKYAKRRPGSTLGLARKIAILCDWRFVMWFKSYHPQRMRRGAK